MAKKENIADSGRATDPRIAAFPGENDLVEVRCVLCGADAYKVVDVQRTFRMVECTRCGLVYQNPRPSAEWLKRAYQNYLPKDRDATAQWTRMMEALYRSARFRLIRRFPAGGKLLDVGCAYGRFLEMMRDAGWHVEGIEVCNAAAELCRLRGLEIKHTTLADASLPPVRYDAVTLFYVLEHLCDPIEGLRKVHSALKAGGICLARVPHTTPLVKLLARLGRRNNLYDLPFHLFDYSPEVLERIFEAAGFRNVRITIDAATRPAALGLRLVSMSASAIGRMLERLSGGRFLLPGVSKTATAEKAA